MKQLFHIVNKEPENTQKILSIRLGEKHCDFSITNKNGNDLFELAYCMVDDGHTDGWNESTLNDLFESYPSLQHTFYQVLVAYDLPQSILAPSVFYKQEESSQLLSTMYGLLPGSHIISERIAEWQLYNTYAVSTEVQGWINKKFPSAQFWHQYSLAVKKINAGNNNGCLLIDFRTDDFTILAANNSRLLLAQAFSYSVPEDVLYHLLKISQQFALSQKEVDLQLSGLIDKQSSLYKELYQYFINVQFREADWGMAGTEYPAHFFTSLNDLAQCVS